MHVHLQMSSSEADYTLFMNVAGLHLVPLRQVETVSSDTGITAIDVRVLAYQCKDDSAACSGVKLSVLLRLPWYVPFDNFSADDSFDEL